MTGREPLAPETRQTAISLQGARALVTVAPARARAALLPVLGGRPPFT